MRTQLFTAAIVFVLGFANIPDAFAANVLVPSCESGDCSQSNLGLVPRESAEEKSPAKPEDQSALLPENLENTITTLDTTPNTTYTNMTIPEAEKKPAITNITPGGTLDKNINISPSPSLTQTTTIPLDSGDDPTAALAKEYAEKYRKMSIKPPLFIKDYDNSIDISELANLYDKSLTITVVPNYVWGENDVEPIIEALGYTAQQIPQNCQLRLDAHLTSNKDSGLYGSNVYAGQTATIRYEGVIKSVEFTPRAVCNPPQGALPQNGSTIRVVGNKYSIQGLELVQCLSAPAEATRLTVQYTGNGTAICNYQ